MPLSNDTFKIVELIDEVASTLSAGESKEVICPNCNGKLFVEKSLFNGHLHANCEGCKFLIIE